MSVTSDLRILYSQIQEVCNCSAVAIYDNNIVVKFYYIVDTKSIALLEKFMGLKGVVTSCNKGICITFNDKRRD